jgi:hypothetical protein
MECGQLSKWHPFNSSRYCKNTKNPTWAIEKHDMHYFLSARLNGRGKKNITPVQIIENILFFDHSIVVVRFGFSIVL